MHTKNDLHNVPATHRGFIAVTAVIMITCSTLLFIAITMKIATDYSDMITRHEWRIQANMNDKSCLYVAASMAAKDYFLNGDVYLSEFNCSASVTRNRVQSTVSIRTKAIFNGVNSSEHSQTFTID